MTGIQNIIRCAAAVLLLALYAIGPAHSLPRDVNNGDPFYLCGEARVAADIDGKCPLPAGSTVTIKMHRTKHHQRRSDRIRDWIDTHYPPIDFKIGARL